MVKQCPFKYLRKNRQIRLILKWLALCLLFGKKKVIKRAWLFVLIHVIKWLPQPLLWRHGTIFLTSAVNIFRPHHNSLERETKGRKINQTQVLKMSNESYYECLNTFRNAQFQKVYLWACIETRTNADTRTFMIYLLGIVSVLQM